MVYNNSQKSQSLLGNCARRNGTVPSKVKLISELPVKGCGKNSLFKLVSYTQCIYY
jgi:hypothetical protein